MGKEQPGTEKKEGVQPPQIRNGFNDRLDVRGAMRRQEIIAHNARVIEGHVKGGVYGPENDKLRGS